MYAANILLCIQQGLPMKKRCDWCGDDPLYQSYHDTEWGVPLRDDRKLFELLMLEGAQAGLSWITILRKREGYRQVFDQFQPHTLAAYTDAQLEQRLKNTAIVRNRLKVFALRKNAVAYLKLLDDEGSFSDYLWRYVDGQAIQNQWHSLAEVPANTPLSDALSKDLKRRGFTFVGSTIAYAFMQSSGMVNDHLVDCYRYKPCQNPG